MWWARVSVGLGPVGWVSGLVSMGLVSMARVALAAEPACVPLADAEVVAVAERVRAERSADEAHDAVFRDLLSRLTCSDAALAGNPWVQLVLAEAHVHHAAASQDDPAPAPTTALAIPVEGPEPVLNDAQADAPADAPADTAPIAAEPEVLEPGPPAPEDEGATARIRVRSPLSVRLLGWTGTFRRGRVPAGRYVVAPRLPPDFEPVPVLVLYAAGDDVWSVHCDRAGACDIMRVSP